jgi:amino acid permease
LTVIETALALICTTIGASFTSIPYSMTVAGFKTGVLVNLIVIMTVLFSAYLYWMARMMTQLTHLSEMLYVTLGRSSIFLLNGILAFIIYGLIVIYLTLGARICRSILTDLDIKTEILHQKWPWVLIISAVLFPLFMRRSLSALTFQTKIMCCGVLVLVFVMSEKALNS